MTATPHSDGTEIKKTTPRWQSIVETLAIVAIALATVWKALPMRVVSLPATNAPKAQPQPKRVEPKVPIQPISLVGAQTLGDRNAQVALVEFTDFQCPYCGQFDREIRPAFQKKYVDSGQVLLAFRNFPLTGHPLAPKAAEAAACSGRQGKFWPMQSLLFADQKELDLDSLRRKAQSLQLGMKSFDACLAGQATESIASDLSAGRALEVTGTPTFFVGRLQNDGSVRVTARFTGLQSMGQISVAIDSLLATR